MDEGSAELLEQASPFLEEAQSVPAPALSEGAQTGPVPSEKRGRWAPGAYFKTTLCGKNSLAVFDQAVVSGTSFLTTILVGRWCGAEELGVYALGFSMLVAWTCVQEALIAVPFTIYRHRPLMGTQAEYAGGALIHQALLSALALITLVVVAAGLSWSAAMPALASVSWTLAWLIPFALLREFGRRFAFAHLRMAEALALDVAVAVVQLAGLSWLISAGRLSASNAYLAIGAACAVSGAAWLYVTRRRFAICWAQARRVLQPSWSLGKWLFASQVTLAVQGYFVHWLLAWMLGVSATGVYAACLTMVLFANPLILGISNALTPRTAHAFAHGGSADLRQVVIRTTLLLGAAMVLFCAVVFVAGDDVMDLLYHGSQYGGHNHTIAVLAVAMLVTALGMPASNGLTVVGRSDAVFKVGLCSLALSVVLTPFLVLEWGVTGASYGFLVGNLAATAGRWLAFSAFLRAARRLDPRSSPSQVLGQFSDCADVGGWIVEKLNEGAQAIIFAARHRDGQAIRQSIPVLVVKLYKAATRHDVGLARKQFAALSHLHAKLSDRTINGWKIVVPVPLYQCDRPLAYVMTMAPGRPLNWFLKTPGQLSADALESIAATVVAAMESYWSIQAQTHGDFNFDNILCDVASRTLSFVDPGVVEDDFHSKDLSDWRPAARDLAYMLYDVVVGVRKTLGNPGVLWRQERLAEKILQAFMSRTLSTWEQHGLLDEIHGCVQVHLNRLRVSWRPRGLWRVILRRIASRRIARILAKLRPDAVNPDAEPAVSAHAYVGADASVATAIGCGASAGADVRGPGRLLFGVFATLDRAGIPYCVLHGYEGFPQRITSDVDCMIPAHVRAEQVAALLVENRAALGAAVVRCLSNYIVLAGRNPDGSRCFLDLDLSVNYVVANRYFCAGSEILKSRRRHHPFWVPSAAIEFGCYLVRKIVKGAINDEQARRLTDLYSQDPTGCRRWIGRFWAADGAAILGAAAGSSHWDAVRRDLRGLRAELMRNAFWRPWRLLGNCWSRMARRMKRLCRPQGGLNIILLGTDGAGKSSVIEAVSRNVGRAFGRTTCYTFPPAVLRRLLRRPEGPVKLPQALPPRSFLASVIRAAGYWFVYYRLLQSFSVRLDLARSTLVWHDRHLVDAIVDAKRYRYAGPRRLLELIWRLIPKPDLVILLDAPAAVVQARKQEVSFAETARQRNDYLALMETLTNGHVVDAAQPLDKVVEDVSEIILRFLNARIRSRLAVEKTQ